MKCAWLVTMAMAAAAAVAMTGCRDDASETTSATQSDGAETTAVGAAADGLVPLSLTLPKPAYAGTPKNVPPGTTVEKPTGKPRPPLMVEPGLSNLSRGKAVSCSDEFIIIGEPAMATDGDKEPGEGHYVELGPGLQWVQVDLGQSSEIHAIALWHFHYDPRVYHDVVVQASDDPEFVAGVTLFNNDQDNSAKLGAGKDREYFETFEGRLIPVAPGKIKARYVRCYTQGSTASDMNHISEIEVYGRPAR